ncbi:hypothetical protein CsSME_00028373 [Camellia sinensis var. sinensis]
MDNMLRGGVHCASPWNSESRANEYPSSSFSMEVSHFQPAFSGPSYVPFPQPSAAGNLYLTPENNSGHAHSNYNDRCNIHENEHGLLDSVTGSVRVPFKRKSPGISVACERGSTSRFYALGERMGNVSTGLSEDMISRCLTETLYSSDQDRGEGSCAICIEEYANEEEIGTMKNCGHEYHVRCIREWLLVKKVCPICKAPALTDSLKEE